MPADRSEVDAHPDPEDDPGRPRCPAESTLGLDRRFDGIGNRVEQDEESVSGVVDLLAALGRNGGPENRMMEREGIVVDEPIRMKCSVLASTSVNNMMSTCSIGVSAANSINTKTRL